MPESIKDYIQNPPTTDEYLVQALKWSRQTRQVVKTRLNTVYGPDDRHRLDLYMPDSHEHPLPVLMFMHGGYWVRGHKDTLGFMAPALLSAPAIFISVGYRLAPETRYPGPVDDCRAALSWVYENISEDGGDPDRIYVGGHSAGGHLAAMITLQTDRLAGAGLPSNVIKGCFPVSGVFDVADTPPERREAFLASPEHAVEASPVHIATGNLVPFFLEIGENDFPNLKSQHVAMVAALESQPGAVEVLERQGHDHFQISLDHADVNSPWTRRIREIMASE